MKNQNQFNIDLYFIRWREGSLSQSEKRKLESWLKQEANQKAWDDLQNVWRSASHLEAPAGTPQDVQWKHLSNRISAVQAKSRIQTPETSSSRSLSWFPGLRVAALSAAVIMTLVLLYKFSFQTSINEVTVPFGQKLQLVLADGSEVQLNAGSTLIYPDKFDSQERVVRLKGEGYFVVVPGSIPFEVKTDRATTRVLGTEFNVRTWDNATEVYVNSGKVSVHSLIAVQASEATVLPGQLATCMDGPVVIQPTHSPGALLSWRQGRLEFRNRPLSSVLGDIRRTYNTEVSADASLLPQTISAVFADESVAEVVQILATTLNAKVEETETGYNLNSKQ